MFNQTSNTIFYLSTDLLSKEKGCHSAKSCLVKILKIKISNKLLSFKCLTCFFVHFLITSLLKFLIKVPFKYHFRPWREGGG